jgi:hypothetical protein
VVVWLLDAPPEVEDPPLEVVEPLVVVDELAGLALDELDVVVVVGLEDEAVELEPPPSE